MRDRFTLYKILAAAIYGGCFALLSLAVYMSGGFEPPIFVAFALAIIVTAAIFSNLLIDMARDSHHASRGIQELVELMKKDRQDTHT